MPHASTYLQEYDAQNRTGRPMDALPGNGRLAALAQGAGLEPASIALEEFHGDGTDGAQAAVHPELSLYPASMVKTPLVVAALTDVAGGRLALDGRHEVTPANMTFNDAPSPLEPGVLARLDELCDLAISRSDNVATNMLFDIVGRDRATAIVRERYGLLRTSFHRKLSGSDPLIADPGWDGTSHNTHPASDAARLFALIALDRVPHSDVVRGALVRQYWNDKLSKGLREGDRFAHKTGDTNDVTHDGGILTTREGRTFVVVVYTGLASTDANNARFGPFMEALRASL